MCSLTTTFRRGPFWGPRAGQQFEWPHSGGHSERKLRSMPLTDIAVRNAKARAKPYKLGDARGLFLLVQPSGGKLWRLKYRIEGHEKKLGFGTYPDVSLSDARKRRDEARELIAAGKDPSREKQRDKARRRLGAENTFSAVAAEYCAKRRRDGEKAWAPATAKRSEYLLSVLNRSIGRLVINEITPADVLTAIRKIEGRGNLESARRTLQLASSVFRYGVATARLPSDPTRDLRGALTSPRVTHYGAITQASLVGQLLRSIDGYEGQGFTRLAMQIAPHVFVRPGELRHADWSEIDLDGALWVIPASKMKTRKAHHIPLSKQAVALFREVQAATGPICAPASRNSSRLCLKRWSRLLRRREPVRPTRGHGRRSQPLISLCRFSCRGFESVVQSQPHQWRASCPAHDDSHPSLSVTHSDDLRLLVYCHAGCEVRKVLAAVGLTMRHLFPSSYAAFRARQAGHNRWALSLKSSHPIHAMTPCSPTLLPRRTSSTGMRCKATHCRTWQEHCQSPLQLSATLTSVLACVADRAVWVFPERDHLGHVVGLVYRDVDNGSKTCEPGSRRGLYYSFTPPSVLADTTQPVYLTEGASDALAVHSLGGIAIGRAAALISAHAASWLRMFLLQNANLLQHPIVVVGDNDSAGRDGAEHLAGFLATSVANCHPIVTYPPMSFKDLREFAASGQFRPGWPLT